MLRESVADDNARVGLSVLSLCQACARSPDRCCHCLSDFVAQLELSLSKARSGGMIGVRARIARMYALRILTSVLMGWKLCVCELTSMLSAYLPPLRIWMHVVLSVLLIALSSCRLAHVC